MKRSKFLMSVLATAAFTSCASNNNPVVSSSVTDNNKPLQSIERSIASSDQVESSAKKAVEDFIFTISENSGGINVRSNWDKLFNKVKENASQSVIESILDDKDDASFNESLMRVMRISEAAPILMRLPSSPKILETIELGEGKTKFSIKPYDEDFAEVYETTCAQKEVRGFFGGKSIKYSCQVTGVEFPTQKLE